MHSLMAKSPDRSIDILLRSIVRIRLTKQKDLCVSALPVGMIQSLLRSPPIFGKIVPPACRLFILLLHLSDQFTM